MEILYPFFIIIGVLLLAGQAWGLWRSWRANRALKRCKECGIVLTAETTEICAHCLWDGSVCFYCEREKCLGECLER